MAKNKRTNNKLTPQQKLFVDKYVELSFNGRKAAIAAKYSGKTADRQASRLLSMGKVQDYLSKRIKAVLGNTDTLSVQLIQKLKDIAFSDVSDVVEWDNDSGLRPISSNELSRSKTYSIAEISSKANHDKFGDITDYDFKVKQTDKLKAIDILAKFCQLYEQGKPEEEDKSDTLNLTKKERSDKLLEYQERLSKLKGK